MDCERVKLGSVAHLRQVFARAAHDRVPFSGGFDLTYRCNFRCRHCYVGHLTGRSRSGAAELPTGDVVDLLRQAAEAGCLMLVFSGGEPLVREDFLDVYQAAKRLGMIVTVFTNGSLISERHLAVFAEYPPHEVEVSVYGATEDTYERVTGIPGSLTRVRLGIDRLLERGITVGLKSMILRDNADEVLAIERLARDLGVPFRADPVVTPRLDGDLGPLEQRVEPVRAVDIEMQLEGYRDSMVSFLEEHTAAPGGQDDMPPVEPDERLYLCGAGKASFQLGPQGLLGPCQMSPITYDARAMGFAGAWKAVTNAVDAAVWEGASACAECPHILLCGYCPALFALEGATPSQPPRYLCRLGESRYRVLGREESEVVGVKAH